MNLVPVGISRHLDISLVPLRLGLASLPVIWMTRGQLNTRCNHLTTSAYTFGQERAADLRGKLERDQMTEVHGITTRSSTSVEVEWKFFLVSVQNQSQITEASAVVPNGAMGS